MMSTPGPQPLIIFLHLPKTAGTTLARIIERQYDSSGILSLYESMFGKELAVVPEHQMDNLRIVMGHLYFGAHAFGARSCTYLTVLREPIDRVISHYYFVRHDPANYLYELARKMTLKEFVESRGRQEPNNDQTRLLAGSSDSASFGICLDETLDIAKRNLAQHFAVIGITEDFNRSLILMKRILGWRNLPFYTKQNVTSRRATKESISPETLQVIQAHNMLDIELYRYAKDLFQDQIRLQGNSIELETNIFRALNVSYGRLRLFTLSTIEHLKRRYLSLRPIQTHE
jgi:hypothetical protein